MKQGLAVKITEDTYSAVEKAVAEGATRDSIANMIGCSRSTLYRLSESDRTLKKALERGDQVDYQVCMSALREKGLKGSFPHLAGYMRVKHQTNISDTNQSQSGNVTIVVNIPFINDTE